MNESQAIGCSTQFDAYFSCADAKYVCTGNVARFAGCADSRARLDACLAKATADTGCAQLAAAVMACPGFDAGVVPGSCSVTRSCESRCVLASEQNVCAPQLAELQAFIDCAKSCP